MSRIPFFSVILPTYGRGRHIKPSIESVLRQGFDDFELVVVGDGCIDETETIVRSFPAERVRWLNLARNSGSQSFPNNEGIRSSHGHWIAYIGHDDIWSPNHLERISHTIKADETLDFAVSGCVFHGPKGSEDYYITGLFDDADAPFHHFFPPTSISHRRDVTARMGGWADPRAVKSPADNEFLLRAANARMRFASTGEITVHKFAAGHRYLSYLRPSCDEQQELLDTLGQPPGLDIAGIVQRSKANHQFMIYQYGDYSSHPEGFLFEQNLKRKGISKPPLRPLRRHALIKQTDEPRGLDWYSAEGNGRRYRWSGPNPRPKILIPYTGRLAKLSVELIDGGAALRPSVCAPRWRWWSRLREILAVFLAGGRARAAHSAGGKCRLEDLSLYVEERPVQCKIKTGRQGMRYLTAEIPLHPVDYTVLTLDAPTFRRKESGRGEDQGKIGVAVGRILIQEIAPRSPIGRGEVGAARATASVGV